MPLATPTPKPTPYAITRDSIASEWQPLWDKLIRAYPFWSFGSTNIEDVRSGANGTANTNVWTNGPYGPALDFNGTQSHVATPSFDPPSRGMVVFLAKFDAGNGATPVHGTLDFESRVSGGNKLLHQFFNRTLSATNYDVPYGSYTLAGLGWDAATGSGPLYKDGALLQTKTGHIVDPGVISTLYIGSSGTQRYLDGVMEMVLILSDWPTQAEWAMLAADPFGWARQATASEPQPVELSGSASGSASASGSVWVRRELSASISGAAAASGELVTRRELAGSVSGAASASGSLAVRHELSGDAAGSAAVAADLSVDKTVELAGGASGWTTASGALSVRRELSGAIAGSGAATVELAVRHELSGSATGSATAAGELSVQYRYASTVRGRATVAGNLAVGREPVELAAAAAGAGSAAGALNVGAALDGTAAGRSLLEGSLTVEHHLSSRIRV